MIPLLAHSLHLPHKVRGFAPHSGCRVRPHHNKTIMHNCQDLIAIFNDLFEQSENTILIGGALEPMYKPCDADHPCHRVIFTRDYFASALHEIAHWCLAGAERRKLVDYGYWYYPEGRTPEQQAQFEQAEVKPQSLEYLFSRAAGSRFIPSRDDFRPDTYGAAEVFADNIMQQAREYERHGLPERAGIFVERVAKFYGGGDFLNF